LGQFIHENHSRATGADLIQRSQLALAPERLTIHLRSVEATQIAYEPPFGIRKHFGMFTAAQIVLQHNLVGRRATELVPLAFVQRKYITKAVVTASDEECTRLRWHEQS
jgi:hypothetical protein